MIEILHFDRDGCDIGPHRKASAKIRRRAITPVISLSLGSENPLRVA